jgi:hypothetical protein
MSCNQIVYYLVELENIKQLEKLLVLFVFLQLDIVLLQAVKGQLGLVIDIHFHRLKNARVSKKGHTTNY